MSRLDRYADLRVAGIEAQARQGTYRAIRVLGIGAKEIGRRVADRKDGITKTRNVQRRQSEKRLRAEIARGR